MIKVVPMPKATAIWLKKNTTLTNIQIANGCGLDITEVRIIEKKYPYLMPFDAIYNGQFTLEDITKCEKDPKRELLPAFDISRVRGRHRIISISMNVLKQVRDNKRQINIIKWLINNFEGIRTEQIKYILSSTTKHVKKLVSNLQENSDLVDSINPIEIGLCSMDTLCKIIKENKKPIVKKNNTSSSKLRW